jgi:hypothetical protein
MAEDPLKKVVRWKKFRDAFGTWGEGWTGELECGHSILVRGRPRVVRRCPTCGGIIREREPPPDTSVQLDLF